MGSCRNGSVGEVIALQAWRPGFGSPAPVEEARCSSMSYNSMTGRQSQEDTGGFAAQPPQVNHELHIE